MIKNYHKFAQVAYMILIVVTIFSPERFGTTLKYAFAPLVLMLFLYGIQMRMTLQKWICILFLNSIGVSTILSDCAGVEKWSANQRSLCIIIILFALLSDIDISIEEFESIKRFYIVCVVVCGVIILFRSVTEPINRYWFTFLWGIKDVNYILAFMLPGSYLAIRKVLFGEEQKKLIPILAFAFTTISVILFQTRAAFVTLLITSALMFIEYLMNKEMSHKKIAIIILVSIAAIGGSVWLISSPEFSRLTSSSSYEDNIRLSIWSEAMKAFHAHPIIGSGTGAASYYSYVVTNYPSHNNYIDIIGDYGIIGATLFSIILLCIVNVEKTHKMHMITFTITSMLPFAFINGFQTIVFWLPLILLTHEGNCLRNESNKNQYME